MIFLFYYFIIFFSVFDLIFLLILKYCWKLRLIKKFKRYINLLRDELFKIVKRYGLYLGMDLKIYLLWSLYCNKYLV